MRQTSIPGMAKCVSFERRAVVIVTPPGAATVRREMDSVVVTLSDAVPMPAQCCLKVISGKPIEHRVRVQWTQPVSAQRKMREYDDWFAARYGRQRAIQPTQRILRNPRAKNIRPVSAIESKKLPIVAVESVMKPRTVDLFVSRKIPRFGAIMISDHGMNRHRQSLEYFVNRAELRRLTALGKVPIQHDKCRPWMKPANARHHPLKPRATSIIAIVHIINDRKTEIRAMPWIFRSEC